jgi:hypothetical protein
MPSRRFPPRVVRWVTREGFKAPRLPILCAIYLMYWHARLDRALDHVFRSATARKRHDQIGLSFDGLVAKANTGGQQTCRGYLTTNCVNDR